MEDVELEESLLFFNACTIRPHANPLTDELESTLQILWWTNAVFLPTIALIGLICNFLNLLVLTTNEAARRMPSWHLLVSLALFDSLFLIFATFEVTPMSIQSMLTFPILNFIYTRIALYIRMCASTFYKASILIVVAFNVERYVCVCRPLWAHRVCTSRVNHFAISLSFLIAFACSIQWPIVYNVIECWDELRSHAYSLIIMSDNPKLQAYYKTMDYLSLVMFNLFPIIILSILNFQLVGTLKRVVNQDMRRNSDSNKPMISVESTNQRLNANAMLFAVVLLLFICIGPQAPARLLYYYYDHYHKTAVLYTCISQQLVFLNASLNFCLYFLVSKRYRGLLCETLYRLLLKLSDYNFCFLSISIGLQLRSKMSSFLLSSPPHSQSQSASASNAPLHVALIFVNNCVTACSEEHPMLERRASDPPMHSISIHAFNA